MRPLKLAEILEAITFDAKRRCFSEDEKLGNPMYVLLICSSLIALSAEQISIKGTDSKTKSIDTSEREVHFHVKEFLINNQSLSNRFHVSIDVVMNWLWRDVLSFCLRPSIAGLHWKTFRFSAILQDPGTNILGNCQWMQLPTILGNHRGYRLTSEFLFKCN